MFFSLLSRRIHKPFNSPDPARPSDGGGQTLELGCGKTFDLLDLELVLCILLVLLIYANIDVSIDIDLID
ncbi:hypothetical protein H1R20_g1703, partial [Candolleomyces eurysporus]